MDTEFLVFLEKNSAKLGTWPDWKRNTFGKMKVPKIKEVAYLLGLLYRDEDWFVATGHDEDGLIIFTKCEVVNIQRTYWDYPLRIVVIGEVSHESEKESNSSSVS